MQIRTEQNNDAKDIFVLVQYAKETPEFTKLMKAIKSCDEKLSVFEENKNTWISLVDIYYFESVDKKTYVYCKQKVFRIDERLYQLKERLANYGFVQVSKSCLLNINVLESIKSMLNSKMQATLTNGEKVWISRKYISEIKEAVTNK